jgi:hypothetical protein
MTQTVDGRLTALRAGPERRRRWVLGRIRLLPRPEPEARPWRGRPDEAYRVLEDARTVIAQGRVQDRWFARRPTASRLRAQPSGAMDDLGDVPAACLVGAVVHAARQGGPGDPVVTAGPALDYLWDAWQESRGLGGTGVVGVAAPRELRMAGVRGLTRWNDRPGRTRAEVLGLIDLAASRAVMAAMTGPR